MADADRDFAYVATLDLSQIEEQVSKLEGRMTAFGSNLEKILNTVAQNTARSFSSIQAPQISTAITSGQNQAGGVSRQVELFTQLEQRMISLIAQNLRLDESISKTNRQFINTSAASATTVDQFRELVTVGGQISETQFAAAQSAANLQSAEREVTALLAQGTEDAGMFARGLGSIRGALSSLEEEDALIQLVAQELRVLETNDKVAQSFTRTAATASPTLKVFNQLVSASSNIAQESIELANNIGKTRQEIAKLATAFAKGQVSEDDYRQELAKLEGQLDSLLKQQKIVISENQRQINSNEQVATSFSELGNTLSRVAQIQQQKGATEFQKVLRTFPQIAKEVRNLSDEYGPFTANIRRAGNNASEQEKEFLRLINTDKRLAAEIDRLTNEYGDFNVAVNRANIGVRQSVEDQGNLGRRLGITTGLTIALSQELQQLARRGAEAFKQLLLDSVKINQEFQASRISFAAIFEGNKEVAAGVFDFVRSESRRLGIDLAQIATSFLPQVENVDQLSQLAELSTELLRLPAAIASGKTQTDAIIAISEFLAGQTRSLQTRFNITIQDTQRLKAALEAGGISAFITELDEVLGELGIEFQDFADTTPFLLNRVNQQVIDLKDILGEPIDAAINDFLVFLEEYLRENEDAIREFTAEFGELVATIGTAVFEKIQNFLESDSIENLTDDVIQAREEFETFVDVLDKVAEVLAFLEDVQTLGFGGDGDKLFEIPDVASLLTNPIGEVIAKIKQLNFEIEPLINTIKSGFEIIKLLITDTKTGVEELFGALQSLGEPVVELTNAVINLFETAQEPLTDVLDGTADLSGAYDEVRDALENVVTSSLSRLGISVDVQEEVTEAVEANTEALLEQADAIKAAHIAEEERLELAKEYETILEETNDIVNDVNRKIVESNAEANRRILENQLDLERKRIDAIIDFSRDRAAIEQDLVDKLDDIDRDFLDDRDDILLEFARDQQDISKDTARELADIERDLAKEKIKIEEDLQETLARIRRKFEFDAQEAIRQNDAVRFLQLRRRLDFELNEASLKRDEDVQDAEQKAEEQKEKVNQKLREQLEDARTERDRALADAKRDADREARDAIEARDRALRDQRLKEKQFTEDLSLERQRRIEDLERWNQERLEKLRASIAEERIEINEGGRRLAEIENRLLQLRLKKYTDFYQNLINLTKKFTIAQEDAITEASSFDRTKIQNTGGLGQQGTGTPGGTTGTATTGQYNNVNELRRLATNYANYYNLATEALLNYIANATQEQLTALIQDLQDGILDNAVPRQSGGPIIPGQTYLVGESGPELIRPHFPGRITPISSAAGFNIPPPGGIQNIDNSRTTTFDVSMLDPTKFSPDQIEIIKAMFGRMFVQAFS